VTENQTPTEPASQPKPPPKSRSLVNIAGIVAAATLLSKVAGLLREATIAAAFGVGSVVGAYQYSSIIPSFFLILLGGINGPFHSALVSVLAKRPKSESAPLVESISTLVGGVLLLATVVLVAFAPQFIDLLAPGLHTTAAGQATREISIQQLRIMAPTAWFAGMIGIGFGSLTAADMYWLPSVSPLFSSVAIIVALGGLALSLGGKIPADAALLGGLALAGATLVGTIFQWLAQMVAQHRAGLGGFRLRFDFQQPGVQQVIKVMAPALFTSGMLYINVYTDMFFASFLPNPDASVSALNYANLLIQAPLGILSSMLLVPFLPVFSRLAAPEHWPELKQRVRQGLLLTAIAMLPLSGLIIALSTPIVRLVYERGAFNQAASEIVTPVLIAYAIGMFVYLGRDVLVRVFYALDDGDTPFRISMVNIFLNAFFDYIMVTFFHLGAAGLVMATVSVNIISMVVLTYCLNRRLNGIPWRQWAGPIGTLLLASGMAGAFSFGALGAVQELMGGARSGFLIHAIELVVPGALGLGFFALIASRMGLEEVDGFADRLRQKLLRR
jgi:putative peptidoglycan lipid II flippase